jgi:hypothetical protein
LLVKLPVGVEKLAFPPNDQIRGIENVSANRERRLYGILTRFYFCEFLGKEFFNSHACLRQSSRGNAKSGTESRHLNGFIPTPSIVPIHRFLRFNTEMNGRDRLLGISGISSTLQNCS